MVLCVDYPAVVQRRAACCAEFVGKVKRTPFKSGSAYFSHGFRFGV